MSAVPNLVDILREKNAAKRRRTLSRLFLQLCGADSTSDTSLSVFSLALGRERLWQEKLLHVLRDLKALFARSDLTKVIGMDKVGLGKTLINASVAVFLVRVLQVELPDKAVGGKLELYHEWPLSYNVAACLLGQLSTVASKDEGAMEELFEQESVEVLVRQLNPKHVQYITKSFVSCTALLQFCNASREACERIIFAGGLSLLGNFILRDTPQQWVARHCKGKMKACEIAYFFDTSSRRCMSMEEKQHQAYMKMLDLSRFAHVDAIKVLGRIVQLNDRTRNEVWKCNETCKAITRWLNSPVVTKNDLKIITAMAKVLGLLCTNEEQVWSMNLTHDIIYMLEAGISLPYREGILAFMELALIFARLGGHCRMEVAESEVILPAVMSCVYSYCPDIQRMSLSLLVSLASNSDSALYVFEAGGTPEFIYLFRNFYSSFAGTAESCALFKKAMARYLSSKWKAAERKFNHHAIQMNSLCSTHLKKEGNDAFNACDFEAAYEAYRCAVVICPPLETHCIVPASSLHELHLPPWETLRFTEWCLPSILYSNMAQCMLKSFNSYEAIRHCTEALGRCLHDSSEATKLRIKIAYRRSRSYLRTDQHLLALNDAAYCYRASVEKDESITSLYREVLLRYRQEYGHEAARVCGVCGRGAGEKLKRCANCTECYCSRDCQKTDWDRGHKTLCDTIRDPDHECDYL